MSDVSWSRRLDDYDIERLLGIGGMAEVYLGRAVAGPWSGRPVAIKRLRRDLADREDILDRFLGEADLARLVTHPSIVEVLETGLMGEQPYLVMEYVDGPDLGRVIDECGRRGMKLPVDFCAHIAIRVLESAEGLHEAVARDGTPLSIVHCDLNPSNVFLTRNGEIKIGDLGVAVVGALEGGGGGGVVAGKLSYLAPEQAAGEVVDHRADLFAIGVMFFELLTGRPPFRADSLEGLLAAVQSGPPDLTELRDDIPSGLPEIVVRALSFETDRRYSRASVLRSALEGFRDPVIGNDLAVAALVRHLRLD